MASDASPDAGALNGDVVELTRALVRIPSVNPVLEKSGTGEEAVALQCAGWLEGWGFDVGVSVVEPGRMNVVARLGSGEPRLILCGHLDTVGVEGMTIDPFDPELRDGRLYGRGSCDMKGGVAAILAAAHALSEEPESLGGELLVALTCDEEHASIGIAALLEAGLTADAAIVTEPTGLAIMPAHKGFFWNEVRVRGVAAHGSRPDVGRDAIRGAGRVLDALDLYEAQVEAGPAHPLLGHGSIHAGTITGGVAPSVYPAECRFVLESRTLPGEGKDTVRAALEPVIEEARRRAPDLRFELEEGLSRTGSEVEEGHPLREGLARALEAEGVPVRTEGMTAWVESALFNEAGIPSVCFGPGAIGKAHTVDEFVPVEELETAARVLTRFAREFLGVTE